ncbi:MAG: hypothetical protein GY714_12960 [Desulfobacterales bacterium]|nr:hypothetical protein [Desulfobacterales bacterium]
MALLRGNDYIESLKRINPEVYIRGKKVEKIYEHPMFRQTINHISAGYELAHDPLYKEQAVVFSEISNEEIPRLQMHIQKTKDDLIKKAILTREISSQRICSGCMSNMLSVTYAMIHDIDSMHGTDYFPRFENFIKRIQKNGELIAWGMMDPKGDRKLPPSKQPESTDLKIVARKKDGIVVNGVKLHTTFAPCAHHVVAVPCRALSEDDKDFAVSFAVPIDTPGIKMIARPSPGPSHEVSIESPLSSKFLGVEAMTIFDNVFIPEENIFMCGQWDIAANLPFYFASLHRQSKCACSAGHADLFAGTAALCAEVNGLGTEVSHIRNKITDMIMSAETAFGCSLGSVETGFTHPSGVYFPNAVIANSGLNSIRSSIGTHISHLHDIAGGLIATMPTEADYNNPKLKKYIESALKGSSKYTTEERFRALNLAQDLAASRLTGTILGFTINAAGSPETNRVVVNRLYDLKKRVDISKQIASIEI